MPFLQISHPRQDTVAVGSVFRIKFNIVNLGKYPAKIMDYKVMGVALDHQITDAEIKSFGGDSLLNFDGYIIKENPMEAEYGDTVILTQKEIDIPQTAKLTTYFVGYLRYQNLITGKDRIYRFRIEMECKTGAWGQFTFNDNRDISPEEAKKSIRLEYWR